MGRLVVLWRTDELVQGTDKESNSREGRDGAKCGERESNCFIDAENGSIWGGSPQSCECVLGVGSPLFPFWFCLDTSRCAFPPSLLELSPGNKKLLLSQSTYDALTVPHLGEKPASKPLRRAILSKDGTASLVPIGKG